MAPVQVEVAVGDRVRVLAVNHSNVAQPYEGIVTHVDLDPFRVAGNNLGFIDHILVRLDNNITTVVCTGWQVVRRADEVSVVDEAWETVPQSEWSTLKPGDVLRLDKRFYDSSMFVGQVGIFSKLESPEIIVWKKQAGDPVNIFATEVSRPIGAKETPVAVEVQSKPAEPPVDWEKKFTQAVADHNAFVKKLLKVGHREAEENGWCSVFEDVLVELGIDKVPVEYDLRVVVDLKFSFAGRIEDISSQAITSALKAAFNSENPPLHELFTEDDDD